MSEHVLVIVLTLMHSGGGTYAWSPYTGLSCTSCSNPIAAPSDTTTYTVTVTSAAGCSNADTITVIFTMPPLQVQEIILLFVKGHPRLFQLREGVRWLLFMESCDGFKFYYWCKPGCKPHCNLHLYCNCY